MRKNYLNKQENSVWILNILLCFLALSIHIGYLIILFFWAILFFLVGNARRISSKKYEKIFMIIRRSFYVFPLLIPLTISNKNIFMSYKENLWIYSLIGVFIGICFVIPKYKHWKIVLTYDFLQYTRPRSSTDWYSLIFILSVGAFAEEYFFRYFIINATDQKYIVLNSILSIIMFFLYHFSTQWSDDFTYYDFLIQLTFATVSIFLYLLSDSLIPSILSHLCYNTPHILMNYKCLRIHKRKITQ